MENFDFSQSNTNVNNTNEVHISYDDESKLEVTSINNVSETLTTSESIEHLESEESSSNIDEKKEESSTSTEENTEITALVEVKPHSLLVAQTMFKKSIKISIKSFLISLSLGFLNLFF